MLALREGEAESPGRALPNGWWGMAILMAGEVTLLTSMIGAYFYLRFTSPDWPQGSIEAPAVALPIAMAAVLVASTLPFAAAAARSSAGPTRRGSDRAAVSPCRPATSPCRSSSYISDLHKFAPDTNAYGSIYFTLLGAHHAHVIAGILLDLWLLARLAGGLTHYRAVAVRAAAVYWYAMAGTGVLIVATQVSAG